jgi:hypothetical protein
MTKVQVPTPQEWNARLSVLIDAIAVLTQDEPALTREVESNPEHMGVMARRFLDAAELLEACAQAMRLAESRIVEASCRQ